MDLLQRLLSPDIQIRNSALKELYMDQVINIKIKQWAKDYNLKNKEPDDILQEGIMLMYEKIHSGGFRKDSNVKTFLLGICRNRIRDAYKRVERVDFKSDIENFDSADEAYDQLIMVEQEAWEEERDAKLNEVLNSMTPNCQEVLKLYYYKNKTTAQIAEERGLKKPNQAKKA